MFKDYISKIVRFENLSVDEVQDAMTMIMTGQATDAQIGGYLVGLSMKGENANEIMGTVQALQHFVRKVRTESLGSDLIDVVGTGGDNSYSFNISTAAAFLVAGTGQKVAKHGNRASSSVCGSADVLEALGVKISMTPEQVEFCIDQLGIGYMFTPSFHPAAKHASGPRRELGTRTIFNICGPLANPASAAYRLIGVYSPDLLHILADVLKTLGCRNALIVHGYGGLDELSTSGPNKISSLRNGVITDFTFDTRGLGLRSISPNDLRGGTAEENAVRMRALLSGRDESTLRDIVLANAAAAMFVVTGEWGISLDAVTNSLNSGAALKKLNDLVSFSQSI